MPGESQEVPSTGRPDPTVRTTEQLLQKVGDSEAEADAKFDAIRERLDGIDKATELLHDDFTRFPTEVQKEVGHLRELFEIRLQAERDIAIIREAYRIELKADSKEALTTALTAAEKAVQAALAAAEKARDQQTIASQLATDKAEKAFVEALAQQQNTFTTAIENIVAGVNEAKAGIADIRSELRGGQQAVTSQQASSSQNWLVIGGIVGILVLLFMMAGFAATIYFATKNGGTP